MSVVAMPTATHLCAVKDDVQVCVKLCAPWNRAMMMSVPRCMSGADLLRHIARLLGRSSFPDSMRLTTRNGCNLRSCMTVEDIAGAHNFADLEMRVRFCGGKGGFGNMLRSQGGRMSARGKYESQDSCRDLQGRRIGVVKQAQLLAEYIAKEPERKAALDEAQKRKYAKLERILGREPKSMEDFTKAAEKLDDAGEGLEESPEPQPGPSTAPKRKERLDDHEYVEQSREIVENARSAVASAMKKRKNKGKARADKPAATAV